MFSVYGTSGQLFRGSMEQLRQIGGVGALARAGAIQPVARDGRDTDSSGLPAGSIAEPHLHESVQVSLHAYHQSQNSQRYRLYRVGDLMSQPVIVLSDTATVFQAWRLLAEKHVGQAPVTNVAGQLVGLVTRAGLCAMNHLPNLQRQLQTWQLHMQLNVREIMFTPVAGVTAESDIRRVARVLLDTGMPGLPVVDGQGRVSGFIARSDILRAVVTDPPLDLWG